MNRLANALAFAAVVIAAFVMDSDLPRKVMSNPLAARMAQTLRSGSLPAAGSLAGLPQVDGGELQRVLERTQAARQRMMQAEMRRVAERVQVQVQRGPGACKVVRLEQ